MKTTASSGTGETNPNKPNFNVARRRLTGGK
jgi:hypothetical protein